MPCPKISAPVYIMYFKAKEEIQARISCMFILILDWSEKTDPRTLEGNW